MIRTDRDAANLHQHAEALQQDLATLALPEPLRQRIQTRLIEHRKALAEHELSRPMTIAQQDEEEEGPSWAMPPPATMRNVSWSGLPPLCQAVVRHSDFPEFTFFEGMTGVTPNHEQPESGSRRRAG